MPYLGESAQANDTNNRSCRSFVEHHMIQTVSAERHSQHHPNQLPLSSSSQSPTSLSTAAEDIYAPRTIMNPGEINCTRLRRGKRKLDSNVVVDPPHIMALRLNNRGVQCIQHGQYKEAVSYFFRAIKLSRSEGIRSNSSSNSLSVILKYHFANSGSCQSSKVRTEACSIDIDERDDRNTTRDCEILEYMDEDFIYSTGILVPSESQARDVTTMQVILSFNMALAHHLSWATARKDSSDTKRLNHIVQLYELSYRLALGIQANRMDNEEFPAEAGSGLCNMKFTLAIINNLAQIHQTLNRDHHGVLENLLSHLMVVATVQQHNSHLNSRRQGNSEDRAGPVDGRGATDTQFDLDGFFQNVLPLLLKSNSAGAA